MNATLRQSIKTLSTFGLLVSTAVALSAQVVINEFVLTHDPGIGRADVNCTINGVFPADRYPCRGVLDYIEIYKETDTVAVGYTVLVVDSNKAGGGNPGRVTGKWYIPAAGPGAFGTAEAGTTHPNLWLSSAVLAGVGSDITDGSATILLVEDPVHTLFTAAQVGTSDIDTLNNFNVSGALGTPGGWPASWWENVIDAVSIRDGRPWSANYQYAQFFINNYGFGISLLPNIDARNAPVYGASLRSSGVTSWQTSDWQRNVYNGYGIPVNQTAYPGGAFPAVLNPSFLDDNILNTPGWLNGLIPADIDIDGTTADIDTTTSTLSFTGTPTQIAPDLVIIPNDAFGETLDSARVAIVDNFSATFDVLAVGTPGSLTPAYNPATGVLTLTGPASVTVYEVALASVTFNSTSASTATRRIAFTGTGRVGELGQTSAYTNTVFRDVAFAPGVTLAKTSPTTDPTNASSLTFSVTFTQAVTGFTSTDIQLVNATIGSFSGSGANYTVTINPVVDSPPLVSAFVPAGVADNSGVPNVASNTLTWDSDRTAPAVTAINRTALGSCSNSTSVTYTVTFSEPVLNIDTTDFAATQVSDTVTGTVASVSAASGTSVTVTVNGIAGEGNLRLDVVGGSNIADDAANLLSNRPYTSGQAYTIDNTAPAAPAISGTITVDSGASNADRYTNDTTPTLSGTTEANATVNLYSNLVGGGSTIIATAVADGSGNWSTTTSALPQGVHSITGTATDCANNVSAASAGLDVTIDTTNPTINIILPTGSVCIDGADTITFVAFDTFTPSPVVTASLNGSIPQVISSGATFSSLTAWGDTADGVVTLTLVATDLAGNTASDSEASLQKDITPPTFTTPPANETVDCGPAGFNDALTAWLDDFAGAVATDNVSSATLSVQGFTTPTSCGNAFTRTYTFRATDACGNFVEDTADFIYRDITDPIVTAPADDTIEGCSTDDIDGDGHLFYSATTEVITDVQFITAGGTLSDGCTDVADLEITYIDVAAGSCPIVVTRTFTITDECGNDTVVVQEFTIEDTTDPVIDTPAGDQTVECDGAGNVAALAAWLSSRGGASASDACSGVTWSNNFTALSDECGATGSATVTFTATDACGNFSTTTATFTIEDTTNPTIGTPASDQTVECDGAGNVAALAAWLSSRGGASASDACSGVTWSNNFTALSDLCGATGSATVTFTATDACGNFSTTTATFTIEDTTNPTIGTPASDQTVECDGAGNAAALAAWLSSRGGASASDACSGVTWSNNFTSLSDDCGATGSATVMFTATDACGNSSTTTATFTIEDTTDPVIGILASDQTVECDGSGNVVALASWLSSRGGASANDACSGVTWSNNFTGLSDDCGATGSATVTFTATDACGNFSTTTATFTIEDTTNPTIGTPAADMTVECDGSGNVAALAAWLSSRGGASASDACSGVTWSNNFTALSNDCGATGSATVTFTATDACGNFSTTTATFTIEDTTNPTIGTPAADMTVECDGSGNVAALAAWLSSRGGATASDTCSGVTWSNNFTGLSDDCGATGSATVTFTATDACGNFSTTTATFTIEDTTNPVIGTPATNPTVECDGAGNTAALNAWLGSNGGASASDTCSGVTWSNDFTSLSDDCGATGSATVTFTATDACGNSSTTVGTFTIEDTTNPTIGTPASDQTVECDGAGNVAALAAWLSSRGGASASDACSGVTWSDDFIALSDDCGATGSATVTFTATDACGNSSTTTATFTIEDTTNPTIGIPASDQTVECDGAGNLVALAAWLSSRGGASASDACSGVTWSDNFGGLSDDCGATGSATVTFTATDACGNFSTTTATFTIEDTTDPTIGTPASDQTVECDGIGNVAALAGWLSSRGGASASDACSGVTWSDNFSGLSDDCGATGSATVTFTATDACGNFSTTTATFTIEDTTDPLIGVSASNQTVECDGVGNTAALDAWLLSNGGASASDTCSGVTWSNNFTGLSDDCGATGSATVTFTATDACGNFSTTTATFTIEDTINPTIGTPAADMTVECDGFGNTTALDAWLSSNGGASASDTCSGVTWFNNFVSLSDDCGNTGSATVTFTAVDQCGNWSNTTATFTIEDTTNPVIGTPASDQTVECDGAGNAVALASWLSTNGGAVAIDACSSVIWSNDFEALSNDCGATGAATVTFTATDECGNTSTTTATFTIEDTTDPVIGTLASNQTVECDGSGNAAALASWLSSNGGAIASDTCSGVTWSNNFVALSDDCGATGSTTVTFTATDACGNFNATTATFTIEDTTNPAIGTPATSPTVQYDGGTAYIDWVDANGGAAATDGCGSIFWDNDSAEQNFDSCGLGTVTVTFTVTDECGNENTTTGSFTYEDTEAPEINGGAESVDVTMDEDACTTGFSVNISAVDDTAITWSLPLDSGPLNGSAYFASSANPPTIAYEPDTNYNGSDSFVVRVTDCAGNTSDITVDITIDPANDRPVLTGELIDTYNGFEDDPAPAGAVGIAVSDLVQLGNNVTDVDVGAVTGIAVTAVDEADGTWYYSVNGGGAWSPMSPVSAAAARNIPADLGRIYFSPNIAFGGNIEDALTYVAWDTSSGAAGDTGDATSGDCDTPYSEASGALDVFIECFNDAPEISGPADIVMDENSVVVANSFAFTGGNLITVDDSDDATLEMSITSTRGTFDVNEALTAYGSGDETSTLALSGSIADLNAILATLIYTPVQSYYGSDTIVITAQDSNSSDCSNGAQEDILEIDVTINNLPDPAVIEAIYPEPFNAHVHFNGNYSAIAGPTNTATVTTTAAHKLVPGDVVQLTRTSGVVYNGVYNVLTTPTTTTFTIDLADGFNAGVPVAYTFTATSGGTWRGGIAYPLSVIVTDDQNAWDELTVTLGAPISSRILAWRRDANLEQNLWEFRLIIDPVTPAGEQNNSGTSFTTTHSMRLTVNDGIYNTTEDLPVVIRASQALHFYRTTPFTYVPGIAFPVEIPYNQNSTAGAIRIEDLFIQGAEPPQWPVYYMFEEASWAGGAHTYVNPRKTSWPSNFTAPINTIFYYVLPTADSPDGPATDTVTFSAQGVVNRTNIRGYGSVRIFPNSVENYALWALKNGVGAATADDDADGIPNWVHYAMGFSPLAGFDAATVVEAGVIAPDSIAPELIDASAYRAAQPFNALAGVSPMVGFTYLRNPAAVDVAYTLEVNTAQTGGTWTPVSYVADEFPAASPANNPLTGALRAMKAYSGRVPPTDAIDAGGDPTYYNVEAFWVEALINDASSTIPASDIERVRLVLTYAGSETFAIELDVVPNTP